MFDEMERVVEAGKSASLAWQNEDARGHFEAVIEAYGENPTVELQILFIQALKGIAELEFRAADYAGAAGRLQRVLALEESNQGDPSFDLLMAHVLRLQREVSGAVGYFERVLVQSNSDPILQARAQGGLAELHGRDDWWSGDVQEIQPKGTLAFEDDFERGFGEGWQGHDWDLEAPTRNGVTIFSRDGRGLGLSGGGNVNAPRILKDWVGDCSAQVLSLPNSEHRPSVGGMVFWQSSESFLTLVRGHFGSADVTMYGVVDSEPHIWGQVRLSGEKVSLKIDREGNVFSAYCGRDAEKWILVGRGEMALGDQIKVGMFASGDIERLVYPGTHRAGTAMKFTQFQIWEDRSSAEDEGFEVEVSEE